MRHNKKFNHLGRTASHRASLLSNMASSLIMHKRITTTLAKAKALKKYVEPLITRSKNDTTTSRRVVFRYLQDKYAVKELFGEIATRVADRPGGYTRIIKLGTRQGDAAPIAFIGSSTSMRTWLRLPRQKRRLAVAAVVARRPRPLRLLSLRQLLPLLRLLRLLLLRLRLPRLNKFHTINFLLYRGEAPVHSDGSFFWPHPASP